MGLAVVQGMKMPASTSIAFALAAFALACGGTDPSTSSTTDTGADSVDAAAPLRDGVAPLPGPGACVAGATAACAGPARCNGFQTCGRDGTFGSCDCSVPGDGGV